VDGSNAAIWMMGLGILLPLLSPGEHVLEMEVVSPSRQYLADRSLMKT
jgi:hypothetical protein